MKTAGFYYTRKDKKEDENSRPPESREQPFINGVDADATSIAQIERIKQMEKSF